ncbi:MAG TPA: phosphotransferase [Thermoanaerobaculia bacterium]|nr:phosphotransferase [Thermoanaerobaculia bacterium]
MYLTASNLAHNLLAQGLITAESVVDGDFTVIEAGRRNRNFKLIRQKSPGLFIKQVQSTATEAAMTLQREAVFYQQLQSRPAFAPLADLAPRFVAFDPPTCALVVELLPQAKSLTEYHFQQGDFPESVGELIGHALGVVHSQPARIAAEPADAAIFPRRLPWILTVDPYTLAPLGQLGNVGQQMAALLQQQPAFFRQLLALQYEWRWDSIIHGDVKWDNLVIFEDADGQPAFRIVDWELVDLGDASWDVGAVFATYLSFWVMTVPLAPGQPTEQAFLDAAPRLAGMQAPLRRFWRTYSDVRGFRPGDERRYLERCLRFCAARLVLAVFEYLYNAQQVNLNALAMLQVSHNIFVAPDRAAAELLGL